MPSNSPSLPVSRCASSSVSAAVPAPPPSVSPRRWRPTISYSATSRSPAIRSVSPISNFSESAVLVSIDASPALRGGRPSTYSSASNGSGTTEAMKLGAKPAVSLSPFSSTNWPSEKMLPSALLHALHPAHALEELGREGRHRAVVGDAARARADRHVGPGEGLVEDVVEGGVDRVREHVAAGDERHAEEDGEGRDERAQLALREPAECHAPQAASCVWSLSTRPSRITIRRSANDAAWSSWVTITTV